MPIPSITAWLNSPDKPYHHGRALYEQYGSDRVLLALVKSGTGPYHFQKLRAGLELLNKNSNLVPKPIIIGALATEAPNPIPHVRENIRNSKFLNPDLTNAPDEITKIRDEKNKRYAQARRLFETIRVMDSREHRLQAGLELLDHMDFVNDSWSVIDEWKESGKVREIKQAETEKEAAALALPELLKEAQNLPTYITKDRKKLAAAKTDKEKMKISLRLEFRIKRLDLIKTRINEIV